MPHLLSAHLRATNDSVAVWTQARPVYQPRELIVKAIYVVIFPTHSPLLGCAFGQINNLRTKLCYVLVARGFLSKHSLNLIDYTDILLV